MKTMYTESGLVKIARRENNSRRSYLVINKLQGKHIPVSPKEAFCMFDALADLLKKEYPKETLLLIGFAETATAIGARAAVRLHAYYMQTTRENIPGAGYFYFTEAHSHATEQKLVKEDLEECLGRADRIIFIEDEITTGNTILNIIDILEKSSPRSLSFSAASLLNGMDEAALERFARRNIFLHYLVKTAHERYDGMAGACCLDGRSISAGLAEPAALASCRISSYINARRCTMGSAYEKACQNLWEQVKSRLHPGSFEHILVLGTEEFMYPALYTGARLEELGNMVKCHSTTRSPIAVSRDDGYPLHERYELESLYEAGRKTYIYDLAKYDRVVILTDAPEGPASDAGERFLMGALSACGNEKIQLFRWCGG